MSSYQYKVVPFIGQVKGNGTAEEVSRQLQATIAQYAAEGWEYYETASITIEVKPGCLAGLFGQKTGYVEHDQLVFRR